MKSKIFLMALVCAGCIFAQGEMADMPGMPGMKQQGAEDFLMNLSSGTSLNPAASAMPMVSQSAGGWRFTLMAQAFLVDTQQKGPRGSDKFYSTNWMMVAAQHKAGARGAFQFDSMLSLEPATITDERYPLLFQTGETAYGKAIVDGQHPHNLFMAIGLTYAYQLSEHATLEVGFHPVGDPTLGPVAYPHRASAAELPEATLSHHLQDSTHIADDVVTAGISYKKFKLEGSGFYGLEPGENRWIINQGRPNSWAARLWYLPSKNWAAQVSTGRLKHPEALEPGNQVRTTASLAYTRGGWSSSMIWGRNHYTSTQQNANSYLVESVLPVRKMNFFTGRVELMDKNELFPGVEPIVTARIGAYTAGYTRDVKVIKDLETGIGANVTFYSLPAAIRPDYGNHPISVNVYVRFRLRPSTA